MNRRDFLAAMALAGVASTIPITLIPAAAPPIDPLRDIAFQRRKQLFDFDTQVGLVAQINVGEERFRHAIRVPAVVWEQFSPAQQEEAWKCVERMTYNHSQKLPVMTGVVLPITEAA